MYSQEVVVPVFFVASVALCPYTGEFVNMNVFF